IRLDDERHDIVRTGEDRCPSVLALFASSALARHVALLALLPAGPCDIYRKIKGGDLKAKAQGPLMEACGKPGAGRWLHVVPSEPRLRLGKWQWEQAIRNMFGVGNTDESKGRVRCCCEGRRLLSELPASHL